MKNENTGWVKLHRDIRDHWIWKDSQKLKWWLDILMECNHQDQKVNIGFELFDCKRGQTLNSLQTWALRWRVDVGMVRRFLKLLQDDKMIVTENVVKTTRITVCNYDNYNGQQHANESQMNSERHANEFVLNTNKNVKNDNNVKKEERDPIAKKRERKSNMILFRESKYFENKQLLIDDLKGTEYSNADLGYYYEALLNWSDSNSNRKVDWLATARNWISRDRKQGALKINFSDNGKRDKNVLKPIGESGFGTL